MRSARANDARGSASILTERKERLTIATISLTSVLESPDANLDRVATHAPGPAGSCR